MTMTPIDFFWYGAIAAIVGMAVALIGGFIITAADDVDSAFAWVILCAVVDVPLVVVLWAIALVWAILHALGAG